MSWFTDEDIYFVYRDKGVDKLKTLVNSVLKLANCSKTFDDFLTVEYDVNYDTVSQCFGDIVEGEVEVEDVNKVIPEIQEWEKGKVSDYDFFNSLPHGRLNEIAKLLLKYFEDDEVVQYTMYCGLKLGVKDDYKDSKEASEIASILTSIAFIFDSFYRYE